MKHLIVKCPPGTNKKSLFVLSAIEAPEMTISQYIAFYGSEYAD
jgi:hypothetical protein